MIPATQLLFTTFAGQNLDMPCAQWKRSMLSGKRSGGLAGAGSPSKRTVRLGLLPAEACSELR